MVTKKRDRKKAAKKRQETEFEQECDKIKEDVEEAIAVLGDSDRRIRITIQDGTSNFYDPHALTAVANEYLEAGWEVKIYEDDEWPNLYMELS